MRLKYLFILFAGCSSFKRNFWYSKFDVCCVINYELKRDGINIIFNNGYFEDDYIKISSEFAVLEGIKLKILNKTDSNAYINWNHARYIDEDGKEHRLIISDLSILKDNLEKTNISILPPLIELPVSLVPSDRIYNDNNILRIKPLFNLDNHPQKYLSKSPAVTFDLNIKSNSFHYYLSFNINERYPLVR